MKASELEALATRALEAPSTLREAPASAELLERLEALSGRDEPARVAWLRFARRVEGDAARSVARACASDASAKVRRLAVASLAREHHAPEHAALLVAALDDEDEGVARAALIGLCEHFTASDVVRDAMVRYVEQRDPNQAGRAGLVLGRARDPRAEALLLDAVARGSHFWHNAGRRPRERAETFRLLAEGARELDAVQAALERGVREDDWSPGKEAAFEGLSRWWSPEALRALYLEAPPATHRPSRPPRSGFDAEAARDALLERWAPGLTAPDAALRRRARAVLRWIKRPEAAEAVLAALPDAEADERGALEALVGTLRML